MEEDKRVALVRAVEREDCDPRSFFIEFSVGVSRETKNRGQERVLQGKTGAEVSPSS